MEGTVDPSVSLSGSAADLERARRDPSMVELLVPANEGSRDRIDRQIDIYGLGRDADNDDRTRAGALLELAAVVGSIASGRVRSLLTLH